MSSGERLTQDGRELDRHAYAASQLELHAIYNKHTTEQDALRTLEMIPPDSIVYLEGLLLETLPQNDLRRHAVDLGQYIRVYGKDDAYVGVRDWVIQEFRNEQDESDSEDHGAFETLIYTTLLERDCQIIHADYSHKLIPEYQGDIDVATNYIARWLHDEKKTGRGIEVPSTGNRYFKHLSDLVHRRWHSVELREESAADVILDDVTSILDDSAMSSAAQRSQNGKLKAFMIYGASHQHSLTERLSTAGVEVISHDVSGVQGGMYIHESYDRFQANFMRTMAFTAFLATTWMLASLPVNEEADDAPLSRMHDALDRLNDDIDHTLEFCSRCLKIQKMIDKNPKKSLNIYWKLVEDYIAT